MKCRDELNDVKTRSFSFSWDKSAGRLATVAGGVRHLGGVILIRALVRNGGSYRSDAKGEAQVGRTHKARVPMQSEGSDQPIVALKPAKAGGAKGLACSALLVDQPSKDGRSL